MKIKSRPVSDEELKKELPKKKYVEMMESLRLIKFASKHKISDFNSTAGLIPIPLHLLKSRISKEDEYYIYKFVAIRCNEQQYQDMRSFLFLMENSDLPEVKIIMEKLKKYGKQKKYYREFMNNIWKRPEKSGFKPGDLTLAGYSKKYDGREK